MRRAKSKNKETPGTPVAVPRTAKGGRRQMLVYMLPDTIRELKRFALDDGRPAYMIIEDLVDAWLAKRRKKK
jgi:hypothetical protein